MRRAESRKLSDEERLGYYNRAIRAWTPENGAALLSHCHFRRGETYIHRYEFPEAEPDLSKSLELDPRNGRAYHLRGRLRARDGRHAAAVSDLREARGLLPDDLEVLLDLADSQREGGRLEDARGSYALASGMAPSDHRPPLGIARLRMARKDWAKALEALESAEELAQGRDPEVYLEQAVSEVALGRPRKGEGRYGQALPLLEEELQDLERSDAHELVLAEARADAAKAYYGRGRVREFLALMDGAREDYTDACDLGHAEACARLPARPERAAKPRRRPAPRAGREADRPRPRRRRWPRPRSAPGERIYAQ